MNRMHRYFIILLTFPLAVCPSGFAFDSVSKISVAASVSFPVTIPQIAHKGLEQISPLTELAVTTGTVTDSAGIATVEISYYSDTRANVVTSVRQVNDNSSKGTLHFFANGAQVSVLTIDAPNNPQQYDFTSQIKVNTKDTQYFYYRIKAINRWGYYSYWPVADSEEFHKVKIDAQANTTVSSTGGTLHLVDGNPNDGETSIDIPPGALDVGTEITITQLNSGDISTVPPGSGMLSGAPVAAYRFEPEGLVFNRMVTINLLFQDIDHDGVVDGSQYSINSLKIMWWDGFEWRLIGGTVDPITNLVSARISHFSMYALFPASALTDNDFRPKERIITPTLIDSKNDYATFGGLQEGDEVNIYDISGQRVRRLLDTNIWNGKDDSGNVAESGLYIYQIKIKSSGKIINGTIVVAK